jgi:hypothetical protein
MRFALEALRVVLSACLIAAPAFSSDLMPASQQNHLIEQYCAVCHTDASMNGGLSLQHYNAADPNPALAAMLLTKLENGAMGAAGSGVPDKPTQEAWIRATTEQARAAKDWTVKRTGPSDSKAAVITASIVREVPARDPKAAGVPLYRLTIGCDVASRAGNVLLTWSPAPQADRTFFVSTDGAPAVPNKVEGREKMGNGSAGTSGRADTALQSLLKAPLPLKSIAISDLFPGEKVEFPLGALDTGSRRELAACFSAETARNSGLQRRFRISCGLYLRSSCGRFHSSLSAQIVDRLSPVFQPTFEVLTAAAHKQTAHCPPLPRHTADCSPYSS